MSTAVLEVNKKATPQNPNNTAAAPDAPPEAVLTQLITGSLGSQAVYVAAQLGIADLLADGPKSVDELAAAAKVDAPSLYRVLRALASFGVLQRAHRQGGLGSGTWLRCVPIFCREPRSRENF